MASAWMRQARMRQARAALRPEPHRPELVPAFGAWLNSYPWDLFVTLTFPWSIHPEQAGKKYRLWVRRLERELQHPVRWARALEWQKRQVVHFHAVVWPVPKETHRVSLALDWRELSGGHAEVERYDPRVGAGAYLGKYLAKGGEVDYSEGKTWWAPRAQGK